MVGDDPVIAFNKTIVRTEQTRKSPTLMMKMHPRKIQTTRTKTLKTMRKVPMVAKVRILFRKRRKQVRRAVNRVKMRNQITRDQ